MIYRSNLPGKEMHVADLLSRNYIENNFHDEIVIDAINYREVNIDKISRAFQCNEFLKKIIEY